MAAPAYHLYEEGLRSTARGPMNRSWPPSRVSSNAPPAHLANSKFRAGESSESSSESTAAESESSSAGKKNQKNVDIDKLRDMQDKPEPAPAPKTQDDLVPEVDQKMYGGGKPVALGAPGAASLRITGPTQRGREAVYGKDAASPQIPSSSSSQTTASGSSFNSLSSSASSSSSSVSSAPIERSAGITIETIKGIVGEVEAQARGEVPIPVKETIEKDDALEKEAATSVKAMKLTNPSSSSSSSGSSSASASVSQKPMSLGSAPAGELGLEPASQASDGIPLPSNIQAALQSAKEHVDSAFAKASVRMNERT